MAETQVFKVPAADGVRIEDGDRTFVVGLDDLYLAVGVADSRHSAKWRTLPADERAAIPFGPDDPAPDDDDEFVRYGSAYWRTLADEFVTSGWETCTPAKARAYRQRILDAVEQAGKDTAPGSA